MECDYTYCPAHRSFHEKADPCQEFFALCMIFSIFPFSQAASVATLPSALLVSDFRSVPLGCSRFIRRCHLIIDLRFPLCKGSLGQDLAAVT